MSRARDNASGTLWLPGEIVQTQHASFTGVQTIAAQDIAAISGLEINFTPKFSNSKILIRGMINSSATYVCTFGILKNNSPIFSGSPNSNSNGSISTVYQFDTGGNNMENVTVEFIDTATSTASINYKIGAASSWGGAIYNLYINDRSTNDMRSMSTMTVMEIKQ